MAAHYNIQIKRSAEKELNALPRDVSDRVIKALLELEQQPRPRGCRKLRGGER
jgi:mRNA interferase RelE/StbE